jgi:hypothetical protein
LLAVFAGFWARAASGPDGNLGFQVVAIVLFAIALTRLWGYGERWVVMARERRRSSESPSSARRTDPYR